MTESESSSVLEPEGGVVRLEDVAAAANVSTITVSRCISNPGRVSGKTREHVLKVAARMGYIPNRLASSLASSKSMVVGAVVPTVSNPVHAEVLQAVSDVLGPAGYQILLGRSDYQKRKEFDLVRTFLGHRVDGLLLTGRDHTEECVAMIRRAGAPTVEMFEHIPDPIDMSVGSSNFDAGLSVGRYLLERGRRTFAFVGHSDFDDSRISGRREGLAAACAEAGAAAPRVYVASSDPGSGGGGEIIGAILREEAQIDAVVFAGHQIAVGAIRYALDVGIDVPGRVGVVGFGDSVIARWISPSLTTVRFPVGQMGAEAGKLLLARMREGEPERRVIRIGFEIQSRDSA